MDDANLYFIFDHYIYGTLSNLIITSIRLTENLCRFYTAEIVAGIKILHEKKIMHRDLKPENIMIDENLHLKIVRYF